MKKKVVVDERELMEMYKVEHYGFWFLYWALLVSIFVQAFFLNVSPAYAAGEWICFMAACLIVVVANLKKGNWDYYTKPTTKTCVVYSLIFGFTFAVIFTAAVVLKWGITGMVSVLATFGMMFVVLTVTILVALLISMKCVKDKRAKLEEQYDDDEE